MQNKIIQDLKAMVAKGDLLDAIEQLRAAGQALPAAVEDDLFLLESRLRQIQQKEVRGVISAEKATLEYNQVREQVLQVLRTYEKTPEERARIALRRKLRWLLPLGGYLLIGFGGTYGLLQPQYGFRIEAELLVERLTFPYLAGPFDLTQGQVQTVTIQNYARAEVEGERLLLGDGESRQLTGGKLTIDALEGIPGIGLRLGPVELERLRPAAGAMLTFSRSETDQRRIDLTVQQADPLPSEWMYRDSVEVLLEYASVAELEGLQAVMEPTELQVFPPVATAREIRINSFAGTTHLSINFAGGFSLIGRSLEIGTPTFYQPIESVAVPTILGGMVRLGRLDREPLRNIELAEGEAFDLYTKRTLELREIQFNNRGIRLVVSGLVDKLETGRNHSLRNPNRLEWLWHSQGAWLLLGGVLYLLLGGLLLIGFRKQSKSY